MQVSNRIVLHFPASDTRQPVIYHLTQDYGLIFNILRAAIGPKEEGLMVLELTGEEADYQRATAFLAGRGINIQPLLQDIRKSDELCVDCGQCTGVCPTGALSLERPSMKVLLDADKCVACGECVKTCPVKAMELQF